jgi:hypothetical protein
MEMRKKFLASMKLVSEERTLAVRAARPALARLVAACAHHSGQSVKLRALLFSLWNGKPADLSDVMTLDWSLRQDLCAVILAFGFGSGPQEFFYQAIETEFRQAGLFDWFIEEGDL